MLLGPSISGYSPTSSYDDLDELRKLLAGNFNRIDVKLCNTDRATREAMAPTMTQLLDTTKRLHTIGLYSKPFPPGSSFNMLHKRAGKAHMLASSIAVTWGGWDWTTFTGDHCESHLQQDLTSAKHYTFVIPLCFGTMGLSDVGNISFSPGDVIALVAGQLPHFLRSPEGQEGYVITCWNEDRAIRLIEYDAWLQSGR